MKAAQSREPPATFRGYAIGGGRRLPFHVELPAARYDQHSRELERFRRQSLRRTKGSSSTSGHSIIAAAMIRSPRSGLQHNCLRHALTRGRLEQTSSVGNRPALGPRSLALRPSCIPAWILALTFLDSFSRPVSRLNAALPGLDFSGCRSWRRQFYVSLLFLPDTSLNERPPCQSPIA